MAGEFSRVGASRALARVLSLIGGNESDQIATWNNGALAAASAWPAAPTISALAKAVPSGAWVCICSLTGTNFDIVQVTANLASGGTVLTNAASGTTRGARANGDPIFILSFAAYLALVTSVTPPADNTLGSEYTATGYARQPVAWQPTTAADPPSTQNSSLLTFGPFTAGTGATISYAMLMDALGGGTVLNMYAWWTLTTAKTPAVNDSATVAAGALTMTAT